MYPPRSPHGTPEGRLKTVKLHGWNATSFKVLEQPLAVWEDDRAVVGYADTGSTWVAAGAPVAAREDQARTVARFSRAAREQGRRTCFFGVEPRFGALVPDYRLIQVGEQPHWDPRRWAHSLKAPSARSLREQIRRARAKGVDVVTLSTAEFEHDIGRVRHLTERWRMRQQLAPMRFLVGQDLLSHPEERRWLVALRNGTWLALLSMVPVYARNGWLLEDLIRDPAAPNGTAEMLVDHAMRLLAADGCSYATLGLAPLAGSVPRWLRVVRRWNGGLFDFEGLRRFKARLRPHDWMPVFIAVPEGTRSSAAILESLRAFAGGSLLRFAAESVLRAPALLLRTLALLLLPWMWAMAAAPARWFPSTLVRWSWVGFDAGLALCLWMLSRRWSGRLSRGLAIATGLDTALTTLQLLVFNRSMIHGPGRGAIAALALAAPALAFGILWSASWRRSPRTPPTPREALAVPREDWERPTRGRSGE